MGTEGSGVYGHPQLHSNFKAIQDDMRPCVFFLCVALELRPFSKTKIRSFFKRRCPKAEMMEAWQMLRPKDRLWPGLQNKTISGLRQSQTTKLRHRGVGLNHTTDRDGAVAQLAECMLSMHKSRVSSSLINFINRAWSSLQSRTQEAGGSRGIRSSKPS